ncbi:hypothetical protein FACS189434_02440 [Bacteroidia bacterium]|nr:hypothetical protein FACS189434_02440 [Bacteroidia bacterium]
MKKKILLGIFALAMVFQAAAQDKAFNFGVKVAPAISWLRIDNKLIEPDGANVKCNVGFIAAWNFAENFSLVSGFNVNSLGGKFKAEIPSDAAAFPPITETVKNKIRLTEFEIPVAFQMKTNDINDFKLYLQLGLGAAYIFNAKDKDKNDIKDARALGLNYFAVGGAEYAVTGGVSLIGQVKYNGGLTSAMSKKHFADTRANFVELGLGVMF